MEDIRPSTSSYDQSQIDHDYQLSLLVNLSQESISDFSSSLNDDDHENISSIANEVICEDNYDPDNPEAKRSNRKNRSAVWDYFTPNEKKSTAKCILCSQQFKFSYGSTSNFRKHLKSSHKLMLSQKDTNIKQCQPKKQIVKKKDSKFESLLLFFFCDNHLPFSLVDSDAFLQFVDFLNPSFQLPSRKLLSNSILDQHYDAIYNKVKSLLNEAESICITTDCWTSIRQQQYIGLTAHFINDNMKLISLLLVAREIEKETADYLSTLISDILLEFNIRDKVNFMVTDNARVMEATANKLGITWNRCLPHTINLVVQKVINFHRIQPIIQKVRSIVSHIHHSPKSSRILNQCQRELSLPEHSLKMEVQTRWNSMLEMLERFVEQQKPLLLAQSQLNIDLPNNSEFKFICFLIKLLKPFKTLTESLSTEKRVSSSSVIYLFSSLQTSINNLKATTEDVMHLELIAFTFKTLTDYKLRSLASNKVYAVSAFLDPRFKRYAFSESGESSNLNYRQARQWTIQEADRISGQTSSSNLIQNDDLTQKYGLFAELERRKLQAISNRLISNDLTEEISSFVMEKAIQIDADPLVYWQNRKEGYPILVHLVRKYLSHVSSSVPCERVFSKLGLIVTERRSNLSPKRVNKICFVKSNRYLFDCTN